MRKVALFVEGQAEQIFVREFLLRWYDYDTNRLGINCLKLVAESLSQAEYDYGNEESEDYYQIINAGNDNKTLSAMLRRAKGLVGAGYEWIVGLRDMYSETYREESPGVISQEVNRMFIDGANDQIAQSEYAGQMKFHFAIMEVEAWMLALLEKWLDPSVTREQLATVFDPQCNLETDVYHPAEKVTEITALGGGRPYDKHKGEVNAIFSSIAKEDYQTLYDSGRCPSFNAFVDSLLRG